MLIYIRPHATIFENRSFLKKSVLLQRFPLLSPASVGTWQSWRIDQILFFLLGRTIFASNRYFRPTFTSPSLPPSTNRTRSTPGFKLHNFSTIILTSKQYLKKKIILYQFLTETVPYKFLLIKKKVQKILTEEFQQRFNEKNSSFWTLFSYHWVD